MGMVWRVTVEDTLYYWIKSPKGAAMYAKIRCIHVQKGKINENGLQFPDRAFKF